MSPKARSRPVSCRIAALSSALSFLWSAVRLFSNFAGGRKRTGTGWWKSSPRSREAIFAIGAIRRSQCAGYDGADAWVSG